MAAEAASTGLSFLGASDSKFLSKKGETTFADAIAGKKLVAIYFSAHWCPPCRGFTPKLAAAFEEWDKSGDIAVVFVSSDRDEESMKAYFEGDHGDWLCLPFADERVKQLKTRFGVSGIPTLVVVNAATGATVDASARATVASKGPEALAHWLKSASSS